MTALRPLHLTIDLSRTSFDTVIVNKTRRDLMELYTTGPDSCQTTKDILCSGVALIEGSLHNGIQAIHRLMRSALDQELIKHNAVSCTPAKHHWTTDLLAPVAITHEHDTSKGIEPLVVTMSLSRVVAGRITEQLDTIIALILRCLPSTSPVLKYDSSRRNIILLIAYFGDMDNVICAERLAGVCEFKTGMFTSEAIRGVKVLQDLWRVMYGSMSMDCADSVQQRALVMRYATILLEIYESMRESINDEDDEELIDCFGILGDKLPYKADLALTPKDNNLHDCLDQATPAEQRLCEADASYAKPKHLPERTSQLLAGLITDYLATATDHYSQIEADQLTKRRNNLQRRCARAR